MCSGCVVAAHFIPFFNDRNGDDASAEGNNKSTFVTRPATCAVRPLDDDGRPS